MSNKPLDLSEQSFIGATLIVGSAVLSVIGVAAIFIEDPVIIVGIAAGAAWSLCIALLVVNSWLRKRIKDLSTDLADERARASADLADEKARVDRFARTADNVSEAVLTVLRMTPEPSPPPRRRRSPQAAPTTVAAKQGD